MIDICSVYCVLCFSMGLVSAFFILCLRNAYEKKRGIKQDYGNLGEVEYKKKVKR